MQYLQENNPAHIDYSKVNIIVHVVFNIMSANLQYKELISLLHHIGSFEGDVHAPLPEETVF